MADLLIRKLNAPAFSWGNLNDSGGIQDLGALRRRYVVALRRADRNDYDDLIAFARS